MFVNVTHADLEKVSFITSDGKMSTCARSVFVNYLKTGKVRTSAPSVRVVGKKRDNSGAIKAYVVMDASGKKAEYSASVLKKAIFAFIVNCVNMRLTNDGKLIDMEEEPVKSASSAQAGTNTGVKQAAHEADSGVKRANSGVIKAASVGTGSSVKIPVGAKAPISADSNVGKCKLFCRQQNEAIESGQASIIYGFDYGETEDDVTLSSVSLCRAPVAYETLDITIPEFVTRLGLTPCSPLWGKLYYRRKENCSFTITVSNKSKLTSVSGLLSNTRHISQEELSKHPAVPLSFVIGQGFDITYIESFEGMFEGQHIKDLVWTPSGINNAKIFDKMFQLVTLTEGTEPLNLANLDVSKATSMHSMFWQMKCNNRTLVLNGWNTGNVADFGKFCDGIENAKISCKSGLDTHSAKHMHNMLTANTWNGWMDMGIWDIVKRLDFSALDAEEGHNCFLTILDGWSGCGKGTELAFGNMELPAGHTVMLFKGRVGAEELGTSVSCIDISSMKLNESAECAFAFRNISGLRTLIVNSEFIKNESAMSKVPEWVTVLNADTSVDERVIDINVGAGTVVEKCKKYLEILKKDSSCQVQFTITRGGNAVLSSVVIPSGTTFVVPDFVSALAESCFSQLVGSVKLVYRGNSISRLCNCFSSMGKSDVIGARLLLLDMSEFNVSGCTSLRCAFSDLNARTLNISGWNTSHVQTMYGMFSGAIIDTIQMTTFNTDSVEDMSDMFYHSIMPRGIARIVPFLRTAKTKKMAGMFDTGFLPEVLDLSKFEVFGVQLAFSGDPAGVTGRCESLVELDISTFGDEDGGLSVPRISWDKYPNLKEIRVSLNFKEVPPAGIRRVYVGTAANLTKVELAKRFEESEHNTNRLKFSYDEEKDEVKLIRVGVLGGEILDVDSRVIPMTNLEHNIVTIPSFVTSIGEGILRDAEYEEMKCYTICNRSAVKDFTRVFANSVGSYSLCMELVESDGIENYTGLFESSDLIAISGTLCMRNAVTCQGLFSGAKVDNISELHLGDTSNVKDMSYMFENAIVNMGVEQIVRSLNTSSCEDMSYMFFCCSSVAKLDLSHFNTSSLKKTESIPYPCRDMVGGISKLLCCQSLEYLDISSFGLESDTDIPNVKYELLPSLRELVVGYSFPDEWLPVEEFAQRIEVKSKALILE